MHRPRVAIVSRDPQMRMHAARAFDDAPLEWQIALFGSAPADADVVVCTAEVEGEGIPLDLDDPARTFARVAALLQEKQVGTVIEVASTGGGTGCTSLALHLAAFLSKSAPALYVESHEGCGARYRLGLDEEIPSWDSCREPDALSLAALPISDGFRALLAPRTDVSVSERQLAVCREAFRHVVVDRGPRATATVEAAARVLLMPTTIPGARRAAQALSDTDSEWIVVGNRLGPGSEATDAALAAVVGRPLSLSLPCSPALRDAEDGGTLLSPSSTGWSRRVAKLAGALSAGAG